MILKLRWRKPEMENFVDSQCLAVRQAVWRMNMDRPSFRLAGFRDDDLTRSPALLAPGAAWAAPRTETLRALLGFYHRHPACPLSEGQEYSISKRLHP